MKHIKRFNESNNQVPPIDSDRWVKPDMSRDFKPNDKVLLYGGEELGMEIGTVTDEQSDGLYGIIEWSDGNKEDHCGMFGDFVNNGGKILDI